MGLFSARRARTLAQPPRRRASFRPRLEILEDRNLLDAGGLDPTFGNGTGTVTTALSAGDDLATSAVVQPDGKIVTAGAAYSSPGDATYQAALVRYNADGSLDSSFGSGGEVFAPEGLSVGYINARPTALLYPTGSANDGKIILAGFTSSDSLARYNPNGTLDTSFGINGIATASFGSTLGLGWLNTAAVLQPDGKIVTFGSSSNDSFVELARFNPDGTLDATFGNGGTVTTSLLSGESGGEEPTLLLQANGGLVVTMSALGGTSIPQHWDLIGYNANGSLNTAFGTGGFVRTTPTPSGDTSAGGAALYPTEGTANDGKIVMIGQGSSPTGARELMVRRYNPNGTLDATFGSRGTVFTTLGTSGSLFGFSALVQPDDKLVVSGLAPGTTNQVVIRYNTNGSLDSSFGVGGIVTTSLGVPMEGRAVVLQPDGDLVVAGNSGPFNDPRTNFAVTRYLGDLTVAVAGFPTQASAGVPGSFTVTIRNGAGTDTGYIGTVFFTSSDPQAVLPPTYTFTAADQGTHTFTATLDTAGIQLITVTDASNGFTGSQTGIAVSPAAASTLRLTGYPSPSNAGLAGSFTVAALDPFGNLATGYTGTIQFSSSDGSAALPASYVFTAGDAGVHAFTATLNTVGTQSLTASDTITGSISGTQTGIAVNPAGLPAVGFTVIGFPVSITAGLSGGITVTVRDANGNVAPSYRGTIHFSSSDTRAGLPADYTFTNLDQGVHTFSPITLVTAGSQSITVTDPATGITGSELGITVQPTTAAKLVLIAPASVASGTAFSLTVEVEDVYGNVVTNYTGTVHFTSSDSTARLPANYTFEASDAGVHTFSGAVTLKKKGTQTITATDTQNSSLTATDSIRVA